MEEPVRRADFRLSLSARRAAASPTLTVLSRANDLAKIVAVLIGDQSRRLLFLPLEKPIQDPIPKLFEHAERFGKDCSG